MVLFRLADGTPSQSEDFCRRVAETAEAGKQAAETQGSALLRTQEQMDALTQAFGLVLSRRHIALGQIKAHGAVELEQLRSQEIPSLRRLVRASRARWINIARAGRRLVRRLARMRAAVAGGHLAESEAGSSESSDLIDGNADAQTAGR